MAVAASMASCRMLPFSVQNFASRSKNQNDATIPIA